MKSIPARPGTPGYLPGSPTHHPDLGPCPFPALPQKAETATSLFPACLPGAFPCPPGPGWLSGPPPCMTKNFSSVWTGLGGGGLGFDRQGWADVRKYERTERKRERERAWSFHGWLAGWWACRQLPGWDFGCWRWGLLIFDLGSLGWIYSTRHRDGQARAAERPPRVARDLARERARVTKISFRLGPWCWFWRKRMPLPFPMGNQLPEDPPTRTM